MGLVQVMVAGTLAAQTKELPLGGDWRFRLDRSDVGVRDNWSSQALPDRIKLPGSLDQNNKGTPAPQHIDCNDPNVLNGLQRPFTYAGAAWYQTTVQIPENWSGKYVSLYLEHSHGNVSGVGG